MFTEYFGFSQNPFSLANDTAFFCMDENKDKICKQVLRNLQDGVSPIVLTGTLGVGKTTLLQYLDTLLPADIQSITPSGTRLDYTERVLMSIDRIIANFHAKMKLLLVVDNAHDIPAADLNLILSIPSDYADKMLSFQILLCGDNGLTAKLNNIDPVKFSGNYPYHYQLPELNEPQIRHYINFRLLQVDYPIATRGELFSADAIAMITRLTQGLPHSINLLCGVSLMEASLNNQQDQINEQHVLEASSLCILPAENSQTAALKASKGHLEKADIAIQNIISDTPRKPVKLTALNYSPIARKKPTIDNLPDSPEQQSLAQAIAQLLSERQLRIYTGSILAIGLGLVGLMHSGYFAKQVNTQVIPENPEAFIATLPVTSAGKNSAATVDITTDEQPYHTENKFNPANTPAFLMPNTLQDTPDLSANTLTPSKTDSSTEQAVLDINLTTLPKNAITRGQSDLINRTGTLNNNAPATQQDQPKQDVAKPLLIKPLQKERSEQHGVHKLNTINVRNLRHEPTHPAQKSAEFDLDSINSQQESPKLIDIPESKPQPPNLEDAEAQIEPIEHKQYKRNAPKHTAKQHIQPINSVMDEQETAARDRAASRLRLDKLGVEFSVDSLMAAAQKGDLQELKLLISGGIPPDIKNRYGQTALMTAARNGHKQVIKELLKLRAHPDVKDKSGRTAQTYASQSRQPEISNLLIRAETLP